MSDLVHSSSESPSAGDGAVEREALARKWAYLLSGTVDVPLTDAQWERELLDLLDAVCQAVHNESCMWRAGEAGERLVALGCTGKDILQCTVDVLGEGLLCLREFQPIECFMGRIVAGLGALSCGYAEANRRKTVEQQENLQRSLLEAQRDLRQSEARFTEVAASTTSGIVITDLDGHLVHTNGVIGDILGYSPAELAGRNLFDLVHPDTAPLLREDYQDLLDGRRDRITQPQRLLRKDGDLARVSLTASLLPGVDDRPSHVVIVVEDDTELILLRNELSRQALHDALTGLPNRQFFTTHVESVLRRVDPVHGVTLFHLGLDAFAVVSAGLGRHVGEHLLVNAGQRLKAVLHGEKAMVARFDSDEFGVLVENTATTPNLVSMVASITKELSEPIYVDGHGVAASASIGVVHRPSPDTGPTELLRAAELALRRAKAGGCGQWELFHPNQDIHDRQTYALAASMPGAWETGELTVLYQPLARLADSRIIGVEALLRWDHPHLGPLPHERCVELAEQTGLILPLGTWLLRTGCQQIRDWRQHLARNLPLTVNLTAHQSSDADLISRVVRILDDTDLPPAQLVVGFPTGALLTERGEATDNLTTLADMGIGTLIHQVGTTTRDLAAVEDLPVRSVRVARWLVARQAQSTSDDSPVTKALRDLRSLVHQAGATLIVDGIQTEAQANWWRNAGADSAQGDYVAPASPPDELATQFDQPAWHT